LFIVVNTDSHQLFPVSYGGGPVLVNPRVAIVLVDPDSSSWWSPGITTPSSEPATLFGAISNLVTKDYSSEYGIPLSQYHNSDNIPVGRGLSLCTYSSGKSWFGPVPASSVTGIVNPVFFRANVIVALRTPCNSNITNTVFLLLYAPPAQRACPNSSRNGTLAGDLHIASIYLEDAGNNCGKLPPSKFEPTALHAAVDFATFAASHELNEVIVDPRPQHNGWLAAGPSGQPEQIADWCTDRNAEGQTTADVDPIHFPYFNYTRDSLGTVVSPYTDLIGFCKPDVSTGIPPG
jgi:hypothetical protein